MTSDLLTASKGFNAMYRLPVSEAPTCANLGEAVFSRLEKFKTILIDEVNEIDEIDTTDPQETLVGLADLLGDICVYCHTEAVKFGIPLDKVLTIIMESNASKLNADGGASYDENGKVLKGPGYWKPEPKIRELLQS